MLCKAVAYSVGIVILLVKKFTSGDHGGNYRKTVLRMVIQMSQMFGKKEWHYMCMYLTVVCKKYMYKTNVV